MNYFIIKEKPKYEIVSEQTDPTAILRTINNDVLDLNYNYIHNIDHEFWDYQTPQKVLLWRLTHCFSNVKPDTDPFTTFNNSNLFETFHCVRDEIEKIPDENIRDKFERYFESLYIVLIEEQELTVDDVKFIRFEDGTCIFHPERLPFLWARAARIPSESNTERLIVNSNKNKNLFKRLGMILIQDSISESDWNVVRQFSNTNLYGKMSAAFVISGVTAAGKSTLINKIVEKYEFLTGKKISILKSGRNGNILFKDKSIFHAGNFHSSSTTYCLKYNNNVSDRGIEDNKLWRGIMSGFRFKTKEEQIDFLVDYLMSTASLNEFYKLFSEYPMAYILLSNVKIARTRMSKRGEGGDDFRSRLPGYFELQNAMYGLYAIMTGIPLFLNTPSQLNWLESVVLIHLLNNHNSDPNPIEFRVCEEEQLIHADEDETQFHEARRSHIFK